jgi:hypothetical protein
LHSRHNVVTLSPYGEVQLNIQQSGGTMSTMNEVVHRLQAQRRQSELQLEKLNLAIRALTSLDGTSAPAGRRKPVFTKAGLARIAAAQRARWAKIKAAQKK